LDSVINRYIFASIKIRTEDPDARWIDEKKNKKTETEKYFGRKETKTIKSGKQETKRKTVGRTYRKTKIEKGKRKKHPPKKIRNRPKTGYFFDLYKKYFGIIKNGLEETLQYRYRRFAK